MPAISVGANLGTRFADRAGHMEFVAVLILDGGPVRMSLSPHSVRGPGMGVHTVDGNGIERQVEALPIRTCQGSLPGVKDIRIADGAESIDIKPRAD